MSQTKRMIDLANSYIRAGELPLMIGIAPFFLIGSNKEENFQLFRERLNVGVHKTLMRKYYKKNITEDFSSTVHNRNIPENAIWFPWLQGIDAAPLFVQSNYQYLKRCFGNDLRLITSENYSDYISLPSIISDRWESGCISRTHFADFLRIQLLDTYGGTWVDATAVVKKDLLQSSTDFLIPQTFAPGRNGSVLPISSWFIHSTRGNKYISRIRDLLCTYWADNKRAIDYFLLHHLMMIASQEMGNYLDDVFPLDNTQPHYLMLKMRKQELTTQEMTKLFNHFKLMKFTNKTQNDVEQRNYQLLIQLLNNQ